MRRPLIAGNWKMYKTTTEAVVTVQQLLPLIKNAAHCDIAVIPPFTALSVVAPLLRDSNCGLGAQNCHYEKEGAFTGEISPAMLADLGCRYVTIGHSERRQYFKESDEWLNKKLKAAIHYGISPIFCIGELLEQREAGQFQTVVGSQVRAGLAGLTGEEFSHIILAYEPVWAIGTGRTATPEMAQQAHQFVRNLISQLYSWDQANRAIILYGGSVKPENITGLMAQPDIDGALVGGASLDAQSFSRIVKY
ncbi:MAG: triose-phosphate isomerase [Acidobacteria bacterium]|nr:triose-phosphate isomerase [Acidobacteriota bacterium]MBI3658662.1 triose-phosphate isomerase [Acidobacteriota bacterium]